MPSTHPLRLHGNHPRTKLCIWIQVQSSVANIGIHGRCNELWRCINTCVYMYIYIYAHTYYVHYIYVHIHRSCFLVFECAGIGFGVKPKNLPPVRFHFGIRYEDLRVCSWRFPKAQRPAKTLATTAWQFQPNGDVASYNFLGVELAAHQYVVCWFLS